MNNHLLIDLRPFTISSSVFSKILSYKNSFKQSSTGSQSIKNLSFTFFKILLFLNLYSNSSLPESIKLRFNLPLSKSINLRIEALINVYNQEYQSQFQQLKIENKEL